MANRSVRPGGRAGSQPISRVRAPEPVVTPINELVPVTANPVLRGIVTKKQTLRTFRDRGRSHHETQAAIAGHLWLSWLTDGAALARTQPMLPTTCSRS